MNRHLTPAAVAAIVAAVLLAPVPVHAEPRGACTVDPRFLPHTADAAQAWFDSCRQRQRQQLPRTADSAEAWLTAPDRAR
jgi:hypothetical protein